MRSSPRKYTGRAHPARTIGWRRAWGRVVARIGVANMRCEQCGGLASRAPRQEKRWVAERRVVPKNGGWRVRSGRRRVAFRGPIRGSDLHDSQLNDMRNLRPPGNFLAGFRSRSIQMAVQKAEGGRISVVLVSLPLLVRGIAATILRSKRRNRSQISGDTVEGRNNRVLRCSYQPLTTKPSTNGSC
jgi:hypothetical protein